MDVNVILSKCVTLLYREAQIENPTENSASLARTVIEKLRITDIKIGMGTQRDATIALRDLVLDMCNQPIGHTYDLSEFLQQVRIVTNGDANLYTAIAQSITEELAAPSLKRVITNLRKSLANEYRDQRTAEIVGKAYRDLNFGRHNIPDLAQYIRNLIVELEVTSTKTTAKDPAIVKSFDLGDDASLTEAFSDVALSCTNDMAFKTGWQELNEALQGGPRPGDTMVIGALQHNYKSGFSLSMFAHFAVFNKPRNKDPNKKPLLYRVTLEDPIRNNAQFLYQLLKYEETNEPVSVKHVSADEMKQYVKQRLQVNGYHVLIEEVNPLVWTTSSLINRIVELESQGYVVEVLSVDYLSKIPTQSDKRGAMGDDTLEQLSMIRAFCSANGILFVTPHQLSTEAKRLLQTVSHEQFLHTIKGGGYFEKTKGLDRIYDIGVLIHKCESIGGDYLHVVIDKHRFPSVVDNHVKNFFLPFDSNKMPIRSNIHLEQHKALRKIPRHVANQTADDAFFAMAS